MVMYVIPAVHYGGREGLPHFANLFRILLIRFANRNSAFLKSVPHIFRVLKILSPNPKSLSRKPFSATIVHTNDWGIATERVKGIQFHS